MGLVIWGSQHRGIKLGDVRRDDEALQGADVVEQPVAAGAPPDRHGDCGGNIGRRGRGRGLRGLQVTACASDDAAVRCGWGGDVVDEGEAHAAGVVAA